MNKNGLAARDAERAASVVQEHINSWQKRKTINCTDESSCFALKFGFSAQFGATIDTDACLRLSAAMAEVQKHLYRVSTSNGLLKSFSLHSSATRNAVEIIDAQIQDVFEQADRGEAGTPFLHKLTSGCSSDLAITRVSEVIFASHASMRYAFFRALWNISKSEDIQDKLSQAMPDSLLMKQTVLETLRHSPPFQLVPKDVTQQIAFSDGQTLNPGDMVLFSPYITHKNPNYYEHPEAFAPEVHFSKDAFKDRPSDAFMAFGEGISRCPGRGVAFQGLTYALHDVYKTYKTTPVSPTSPTLYCDVFMNPDPKTTLSVSPR